MPRLSRHLPLATLALGLLASAAQASNVYDLAADWNLPNNPNGTWAYNQGSALLPFQASVDPLSGGPAYAPSPHYGDFLPLVWYGNSGTIYVHSVDAYNGNPGLGQANITWTAPHDAIVDITGYLYNGQTGYGRSNDYFLNLGSTPLASGTINDSIGYDQAHEIPFSFSALPVTAGEVLSLTLQRTAGYAPGTIAAMDWTITEVPEPASLSLLAISSVALVSRRRRRC